MLVIYEFSASYNDFMLWSFDVAIDEGVYFSNFVLSD